MNAVETEMVAAAIRGAMECGFWVGVLACSAALSVVRAVLVGLEHRYGDRFEAWMNKRFPL